MMHLRLSEIRQVLSLPAASTDAVIESIVTDSRNARDGRNIERVGYYNPVAVGGEKRVELNTDRVKHWVANGAQLTDKVAVLYKEAAKAAPAA